MLNDKLVREVIQPTQSTPSTTPPPQHVRVLDIMRWSGREQRHRTLVLARAALDAKLTRLP
jgi:hypothetical protein